MIMQGSTKANADVSNNLWRENWTENGLAHLHSSKLQRVHKETIVEGQK